MCVINFYLLNFFKSQKDDKPTLTAFLSVENLDENSNDDENSDKDEKKTDLQKRNLSLPTIDLEIEKIDRIKSNSFNQLSNVKRTERNSFSINSKLLNNHKKLDKNDQSVFRSKPKQEINKQVHLDWSNKMKFWQQLPNKNHQNYHLLGRKFKSGELIDNDLPIYESKSRRNTWWFGDHRNRKDNSLIEIISLKQRSINDSNIQHFFNTNQFDLRKDSCLQIINSQQQSCSKINDLNFNRHSNHHKPAITINDNLIDQFDNSFFHINDDEQDENGFKVGRIFFSSFFFFGDELC